MSYTETETKKWSFTNPYQNPNYYEKLLCKRQEQNINIVIIAYIFYNYFVILDFDILAKHLMNFGTVFTRDDKFQLYFLTFNV